ncbi:DNA mismatch repair endonuclease MutL [Albibacterium bauzanense]|uniref:DNA mismatch repair protein MutL n=1 Tax=Albibacterium bauzanense TaxID=653929 RepID=A0A4R1LZX3_9SPHI|nr:DNA mismatch repair endonuclease MutL [Albibacterium bauzanense]TCK82809.1 DNA mismatch repair protein MutL [Albibacterium bauzanense]
MSDIISLLPDSVANQIAAGEVVQRPASAVKELLENSIDAGADKIQLIIKDAGKSLIQVIDNGCGMSVTDARLCFERHATSKIKRAEDLFAIRTMGFRGEAMASIAAIAQVELKTRRHEDELGTCVEIEGSKVINQEPIATAAGTSISIKNLFYNIPARRNFLKSNSVELKHIVDEFQRLALANPGIFFSLHHDGNELFHLPVSGLKQRIIHVFGSSYNQRLVPVEEETSIINLKGFVGKPEFAKKTRGEQYFFVNKRFIKDPYLNHAVMGAYNELLSTDSYPLYVLFIDIDPSKIDINVHPTKTEIKYQDDRSIYAIVRSAVKRSLGKYNITPSLDFNQETGFNQMISPKPMNEIVAPSISFNPKFNPFDDAGKSKQTGISGSGGNSSFKSPINHNWETLYEISDKAEVSQLHLHNEENVKTTFSSEKQIFQLHNCLIISQIKSGFIVVEQQSAHERVLYERFIQQLENHKGASQQSLFPQTVTLSTSDFELIQDLLPQIEVLGFQVRPFGKTALIIEGIPADIGPGFSETQVIEQLLETYKNYQAVDRLSKRESLARSLARNAAIKSGTSLSKEAMGDLIDQLFACESPNVSLSGKPIIITFTLKELLEKFGKLN